MSFIDPFIHGKPVRSSPIENSSTTTAANMAQQMKYVLDLLEDVAIFCQRYDIAGDIANLTTSFESEIEQKPPPLQTMQNELNKMINSFNAGKFTVLFPVWDITDGGKTGYSFVNFMHSFAIFIDGESSQNPAVHKWVAYFGNYLNQNQKWDAQDVYKDIKAFLTDINSIKSGNPFFFEEIPPNFFQ